MVKKSKKMAYNIHWQVKFRDLDGTLLTVSIYDDAASQSTWPLQLTPAAVPFETQEDDTTDAFTPVRTQSGYLRIADSGAAYTNAGRAVAFNWRDLVPSVDTDRPVTLVRGSTLVWQGFMQAQTFGGQLYETPQTRAFPLMCVLSATEGFDINFEQPKIQNFAYLLDRIVGCVDTPSIEKIFIGGGAKAQQMLLKKIDWQHFVKVVANDKLDARYNLFECLQDMCRFWGWTARTSRDNLYLTCPDDATMTGVLQLTRAQLTTMAGGTLSGTIVSNPSSRPVPINVFQSTANEDYQERGPQKAIVQADGDTADPELMGMAPDSVVKTMEELGWQDAIPGTGDDFGKWVQFTNNLQQFSYPFFAGTAVSGSASFNVRAAYTSDDSLNKDKTAVIRFVNRAGSAAVAQIDSVYEHAFGDGNITLLGDVYRGVNKYENLLEHTNIGVKSMIVRLGIGPSRESSDTYWFNGRQWVQGTASTFEVTVGNADNILRVKTVVSVGSTFFNDSIRVTTPMIGRVFIDFFGSDNINNQGTIVSDSDYSFDLGGFSITFERNLTYQLSGSSGSQWGGERRTSIVERSDVREYTAENENRNRMDWNCDCIYASDNNMLFGYGVVIEPNGAYMTDFYYSSELQETPEQHFANRVANYWRKSRRRLKLDIAFTSASVYVAGQTFTLDGVKYMSLGFTDSWRDRRRTLNLMELDS